ncbi:hypothetical protein SLE2022_008490 [Rubroshorea leprosula]
MGKGKESIPTIDLSNFPGEYGKLREACAEWGCFRMVNHGIPLDLMWDMKKVARSLLDLPMEIKRRNTDVIARSGYQEPSPVNPLYESLGLYDMASSHSVQTFCSQLDASPHQSEIMEKYTQAIYALTMEIGGKLAESLGLNSDFCKEWPCLFRINKYNFTPEVVGSTGAQIHTDSSFLTILQLDENVGGLEVMEKNSGAIIPVDHLPGALLINLGDVATAWSNGRLFNVKHRVQCKEAAVRVSIATFLLGPKEAAVEAPPELVDAEHPRLYVPFTYEEYRKLRISSKCAAGTVDLLRIHS